MVGTKKVPRSKRDVYEKFKHQNKQFEQADVNKSTGNQHGYKHPKDTADSSGPECNDDTTGAAPKNNKDEPDMAAKRGMQSQTPTGTEDNDETNKKPPDIVNTHTVAFEEHVIGYSDAMDKKSGVRHHAKIVAVDATDAGEDDNKDIKVSSLEIASNLISIGSYIMDIGSDIWLVFYYYTNNHTWWLIMTLTFIAVPAITMTLFSLRWYIDDYKHEKRTFGMKVSGLRWMSRFTFLFLQLAPVLRYIDVMIYGCRSKAEKDQKKKRTWYKLMLYEDTDSAMLRLFECFMEAAPQLVLQLYIMTQLGVSEGFMVVGGLSLAIATSLGSMAWSLCSYHRALRDSLKDKAKMRVCSTVMQFAWHFFIIGSRVVALAMFASVFKLWVFPIVGVHWILMWTWIATRHTQFCHSRAEEILFNMIVALVYIFCFFNVFQGHTRLYYIFYYIIMYMENFGMVVSWYFETESQDLWYHLPVLNCVLVGFFVAIAIQCIYYRCCHPNNVKSSEEFSQIKIWLTWDEMTNKVTHRVEKNIPEYPEKIPLTQTPKETSKSGNVGDGEKIVITIEGNADEEDCSSDQKGQTKNLLPTKEGPSVSDDSGFDTVDNGSGKPEESFSDKKTCNKTETSDGNEQANYNSKRSNDTEMNIKQNIEDEKQNKKEETSNTSKLMETKDKSLKEEVTESQENATDPLLQK